MDFTPLKKIREINPVSNIVVVTADLTLEADQKLEELKIKSVIHKPYGIDEIKHVLEQYNINPSRS